MNASMEPIYRRATARGRTPALPPEFGAVVRGGFVLSDERLFLARSRHASKIPDGFDDFDAEGWVNKLHLDTATPPIARSWRAELLRNGLFLAKRLMPKAVVLTDLPVQIVISLQSSPDNVDPECDFAMGALHVRLVRCAQDDMAVGVENNMQPVLVLTETATSLAGEAVEAGRLASRQDVREGLTRASRNLSAWLMQRGGCLGCGLLRGR